MGRDLAIDLGSATVLVYRTGEGIVLREPSVVALREGRVVTFGARSWEAIDRSPGTITAARPLRTGTIDDFDIMQQLLHAVFRRVGITRFPRPNVVITTPSTITQVGRRALQEAGKRAGARLALTVDEPLAAAIGAGLPVSEPTGSLIVDVGGGITEYAVVSMGGVVDGRALPVGGFDLDAAIQRHALERYGVVIGDRTAERVKMTIGSAYPTGGGIKVVRVRGREEATGGPRDLDLTEDEVREAMADPIGQIVDTARRALAEAPPELTHDILETGMFLTGGGGALRGLDMRLAQECEVPVHLTEASADTVALGAGALAEDFAIFKATAVRG